MDIIKSLINSIPVIIGIALVAMSLGGRWVLVTGIILIILGVVLR